MEFASLTLPLPALGFGTLWEFRGLINSANDCEFLGTEANREYQTLSGCSAGTMPVDGSAVGCDSHLSGTFAWTIMVP